MVSPTTACLSIVRAKVSKPTSVFFAVACVYDDQGHSYLETPIREGLLTDGHGDFVHKKAGGEEQGIVFARNGNFGRICG